MLKQEKSKGIKFPIDVHDWISESAKKSVRSFTGELVYRLRKLKEDEDNAKVTNSN